MGRNYQQIDSIFGADVPLCGVNLKRLWCEYTCSTDKTQFVEGNGYANVPGDDGPVNMTKVTFWVDEDMACKMFKSCEKVSLIAQASLQSSIAFLDFLGVNGQNQSFSIITFKVGDSDSAKSYDGPTKSCSGIGNEITVEYGHVPNKIENPEILLNATSLVEEQDTKPALAVVDADPPSTLTKALNFTAHPCNMKIPAN